MSVESQEAVVSSSRSKIVRTILEALKISDHHVTAVTLSFRAQQLAVVSVDFAMTDSMDTAISNELQTVHYAMLQQTEQVTEQVGEDNSEHESLED